MGKKEKINEARILYEEIINKLIHNKDEWQKFLDFSNEFYKYSFMENLLMYVQNPNVTMCATLEQWNSVGRWVKKGSKGIRIINEQDDEISLKYVFDITSTYGDKRVLALKWSASENEIVETLNNYFNNQDLDSIENIIANYVNTQIDGGLFGNLTIDEIKELINVEFLECLIKNTTYQVCKRCGIEVKDTNRIFREYTTIKNYKSLILLGDSINKCSKELLRIIEYKLKQNRNKSKGEDYEIRKVWNDNKEKYEELIPNEIQRTNNNRDDNGQSDTARTGGIRAEGSNRETNESKTSSSDYERVLSTSKIQSDDRRDSGRTTTTDVGRKNINYEETEKTVSSFLPTNIDESVIKKVLLYGSITEGWEERIKHILSDTEINFKEKVKLIKGEYGYCGASFDIDNIKTGFFNSTAKGIEISNKKGVEIILSWEDVTRRFEDIFEIKNVQLGFQNILDNNEIDYISNDVFIENTKIEIVDKINYKILNLNEKTSNLKLKYKENIDAINLLNIIEIENRLATSNEQEILSKYNGWGGLSRVFDSKALDFKEEYEELKQILSDEEYNQAKLSVLSSFYTDTEVIDSIYNGIERLGFKGGNILEPSARGRKFFRKIT